MATGEDSAGKAFKAVLPELKAVLQRTEAPLPPEDKMRLLMMCPLRPLPPARCLLLPTHSTDTRCHHTPHAAAPDALHTIYS